jgi:hypothetical protein
MKGGNAYACVFNPVGVPAQDQGGGDSDWDTQVIVNPLGSIAHPDLSLRPLRGHRQGPDGEVRGGDRACGGNSGTSAVSVVSAKPSSGVGAG